MMKQLLVLLLILYSVSWPAFSQDWQWVKDAGGPGYGESSRIATDASGNSYVTGNYAQSITFGTTTLTGGPDGNAFLVKYNNDGQLVWAKQIKGTSVVETMDMAVDGSGNIYVTGNFKGTATAGGFTLTSPDDRAAFVAKLDAAGNVVWAKQANSREGDVKGESITVDGSGNVYVTGNFFSSATFGATTITATRDEQVFIAKYAANGNLTWAKMAGGLGSCFTHDITTDNSGNLYLTGQFWLTATFGSTTLYKNDAITSPGEIFIAKYDASGNALWAKQAGGAGSDAATGIVVDSNGNSYITGFFQGTAAFGYISVSGSSGRNMFLAEYTTSGDLYLLKSQSGSGDVVGTGIGLDAAGNIYTTGYFEGSVSFGNATLISYGSFDMFFAKYNAVGTVTGAMQAGGSGTDKAKDIDVNTNGQVYFTGDFEAPAIFGSATPSGNIAIGKINAISYNQEPAPTISLGHLSTSILCAGETLDVAFTTTGRFGDDNVFTVQLSNPSGSFSYLTEIGSGTSSPVRVTVPTEVTVGTTYRVRVVTSSPKVQSAANGQNLTVSKPPVVTASVASKVIPAGASTTLYAAGADSYVWYPATGLSNAHAVSPVATPLSTTTYAVTGTKGGCSSTAKVTVKVEPIPAPGSAFGWASVKSGGATSDTEAMATVADADGNVYVAGHFSNQITFGATVLTVPGYVGYDQIFIVKYDAAGQVVWAKQVGGTYNDSVKDLTLDKQGNLYITGWFDPSITIGSKTFIGEEQGINFFIAKFDTNGNPVWANQVKGPYNEVMAVATGPNGEAYLAGTFGGTATFDGFSLESSAIKDYFLVKYETDGKVAWAESISGTSVKGYRPLDLATDREGNVYATGCFNKGTLVFGSTTLTSGIEFTNSFLAKYNPNGQPQWANFIGQNTYNNGHTTSSFIAVDENDAIYISGAANQYTRFENAAQVGAGISGNFLAKYGADGTLTWAAQAGGASVTGLALDTKGFVYTTGHFNSSAVFGTKCFAIASTEYAVYVAKYDAQGNAVWAETAKANRFWDVMSNGLSVDHDQNIYIAGVFDRYGAQEPVSFGCHTVQSDASEHGHYYIAKLSPISGELPAIVTGNLASNSVCAGATIDVPFTVANGGNACASYTVLLSNAQGSFENAKIIGAGATSPILATLPANTAAGDGYRIKVIGAGPAITGTDNGANITVAALPVVYISASKTAPCPGTENIIYTATSASTQITSYTWSVPADWVITEGQGTNRIKVTAGASAGEVTVVVRNSCETEVIKSIPATPANISAPTVWNTTQSLCGAGNTVFTASGAPYGATYRWYASATDTEPIWENTPYGSESRFYTPVVSVNTTFYVSLLFSNGCESERVPLTITIVSKPEMPEQIAKTGESACAGTELTFEVPAVSGAYGYEWTVPYGWQIISGQGSTRVVARAGDTGGTISVAAYNGCGYSAHQTVAVASGTPLAPSTFSGSRCGAGVVTVHAFDGPVGGVYRWYQTASGSTAIAEGSDNAFATPVLTTTTVYYVSAVAPGGCESPRTAVAAVINPAATATAGPDETHCFEKGGYMLTGFGPNGGTWSGKGVTNGGYFDPARAGAGTHILTYTVTKDDCTATATKQITVLDAPTVTLAAFSSVCSTVRDYILTGGQPAGGVYSGIGVENGLFNPVDSVGVGTYEIAYTYTNANGCTTTAWQNLTVTTCTGLPESKLAAKLVVYPNPTQSDLNVALPLSKGTAFILRLFDAKGQKVYEQQYPKLFGEFKQVVSLKNKPKGVYLLQLILDDGVVTKRVVVE